MVGPALLYLLLSWVQGRPDLSRGWAIPCATDIAFSYLVLKAIFRQHSAIPFLLLLAIVDDALGLMILAVFYPVGPIQFGPALGFLGASLTVCWLLRRQRIVSFWPYLIGGGALSWLALHFGGLHPALALVPVVPFMPHAARDPGLFVEAPPESHDTLSSFEHAFRLPVQAVLFAFGLVNAGVAFERVGPGTWTVLIAILAGKPTGILIAVALAVWGGLHMPKQVAWRELVVVGFAAGIGFTVALFFATAAFPPGPVLDQAKIGALLSVGSALAAFLAARVLRVGRFRASKAT
jgi:NhaA family Na+:H+ antiporter